jgi:hypothetical protein
MRARQKAHSPRQDHAKSCAPGPAAACHAPAARQRVGRRRRAHLALLARADPGEVLLAAADPALGEPPGAAQRWRSRAAEQHRWVRSLHRQRAHVQARHDVELAGEHHCAGFNSRRAVRFPRPTGSPSALERAVRGKRAPGRCHGNADSRSRSKQGGRPTCSAPVLDPPRWRRHRRWMRTRGGRTTMAAFQAAARVTPTTGPVSTAARHRPGGRPQDCDPAGWATVRFPSLRLGARP